ncbi:MAG TPA: transglycosylase family protein [Baekduia sp.]|nr:transglycosylase family protein [Baekduia sp.]
MHHDFDRAFQASLERSRARRLATAARRSVLRRRRRRGGSASVALLGAVLALGAPLALGATSAQAPAPTLLRAGASGTAVTQLQRALGVQPTGWFGPITKRAVRRFQRRHGLAVDGIVGPQTAAALGLSPGAVVREAAPSSGRRAPSPVLTRIAACESGGNPSAVSPDGRYRGKYQFTRATWRALGGSGDPAAAPESLQDRLAAKLYAQRGAAPWPACGR